MANTTGTTGTTTAGSTPTTIINPQSLVFHIDLLLCTIILIFILFRIPRTFARLSKWYEWKHGFILHRVQLGNTGWHHPRRRGHSRKHTVGLITAAGLKIGYPEPVVLRNDGSRSELRRVASDNSHIHLVEKPSSSHPRITTSSYPAHIPSTLHPSLSPILSALRTRTKILPGISLAQLLIILIYTCVFCYAAFLYSNPFTDPVRAGWIAASQVPLVVAFGVKNGVVGALAGVGYERLNFFHRVLGQFLFLAINVHGLGYIYKWQLAGTFSTYITSKSNIWGFVGLISVDLLIVICSIKPIRRNFHTFFITTHVAGFILTLVACYMHRPQATTYYVFVACGIYALDRIILRTLKTRITTATIRPIPELGCTRVDIPSINAGWRAGQHIRLQVLSASGMGVMGWMEVHPFTIVSACESASGEGVVLMCRDVGGWTGRLYEMAARRKSVDGMGSKVRVMVEGPYGGPGNTVFTSFSSAVMIVGGSGITFGLSVVQDIVKRELEGRSRVRVLHLVWIIKDPTSITPLLPLFTSLIQQSHSQFQSPQEHTPSFSLSISIYITGNSSSSSKILSFHHPHLHIHSNRPNISHVLEGAVDESVKSMPQNEVKGMIVGVCGPSGLGDDVAREVGNVSWCRKDGVGGVEIHEETFGI